MSTSMTRYPAAKLKMEGVGNPFGAPRLSAYGTLIETSIAHYKTNAALHAMGVEIFSEPWQKTMSTGLQASLDHVKTKGNLEHFAISGNYAMSRTTKDGSQITAFSFSEGRILHVEAKQFGLLGAYKCDLLDCVLLPWLEYLTGETAPKGPIEWAIEKLP